MKGTMGVRGKGICCARAKKASSSDNNNNNKIIIRVPGIIFSDHVVAFIEL